MEVEINVSNLIDSPYTEFSKDIFSFDAAQVDDFVNELCYGPPTCYLVSGYRGVGKTSMINKVENEITNLAQENSGDDDVVFVYSSFAQYTPQTHLIRKLIRELYLKIEATEKYTKLKPKGKNNINFKKQFETLYQQTFKEVAEISEDGTHHELTITSEINIKDLVKRIALELTPVAGLILYTFNSKPNLGWILDFLVPIVFSIWTLFNIIALQVNLLKRKRSSHNIYTKTLFDDEIAETHFFDILSELKDYGFKIVFVLDELDKVDFKELEPLLSKLKPFLVCGRASFVVVGGQHLFYKFTEEDAIDDAVLSSLFSKVYHVPISTAGTLKNLFYSRIIKKESFDKLSAVEKDRLDIFVDYLIFKSRLIPRRFINKVRQNTTWKSKIGFLVDDQSPPYSNLCKIIIGIIDKIDDTIVSSNTSGALRDHIIMRMLLKSYEILESKSKTFTRSQFLNGK